MFDHVTLMTLDSLMKCVFSYKSNCQQLTSEYVSAIMELSDLIIDRHLILHHWDWLYWKTQQGKKFKKALSVVHGYSACTNPGCYVLLCSKISGVLQDDDGLGLTDEEIQAEANTFMFAGHDTTTSAICWTLYNLARHAYFQEKCRQEVMDLMQGRDRHEIENEDSLIRESLRLHSPVQAVTRQYTQDMALFVITRKFSPGAICLVSIYGTHHNPTVWTNPNEFDPLRFDPSDTKKRPSHAFIPFSSVSSSTLHFEVTTLGHFNVTQPETCVRAEAARSGLRREKRTMWQRGTMLAALLAAVTGQSGELCFYFFNVLQFWLMSTALSVQIVLHHCGFPHARPAPPRIMFILYSRWGRFYFLS
uniref:aromatase n=1 Tax=Scophthalmus maximus TaxID=52904 RepID=A0A8D3E953_SCOMX